MDSLKITLIGAGAVGGVIASGLERSGTPVSLLVRPERKAALAERGLLLRDGDGVHTTRHRVETDARELGVQDVVIICLKAPALAQAAEQIAPLIGPETLIIPAMNGIPWWFFEGFNGPLRGQRLRTVDPSGERARLLPAAQTLGCVVYFAVHVDAEGIVCPAPGCKLILGEAMPGADGSKVERIAMLLQAAGIAIERSADIRRDVWLKLLGNLVGNPLGALTGCTIGGTLDNTYTPRLVTSMMQEATEVAQRIGLSLNVDIAERVEGQRRLSASKSSMLQDVEAGRVLEIDAIIGSVSEIGDIADVDTPFIDAVLGLVQLRAQTLKLWTQPSNA